MVTAYENPRTGAQWPLDEPLWRAPDDHGPVALTLGAGLRPDVINPDEQSLWRYRAAIRTKCHISLGEGLTPLVDADWDGVSIQLKCEHLQPSGSYKDRGISVLVNEMVERGVTEILEDSSGNAGASMATYCAQAGIDASIYVPAAAPEGKLQQIQAMGATLRRIPGTRQDTTDAALAAAETRFYASHCWQPFFLEGTKTLAFELWEQNGFTAPDNVITPVGQGGNVLGLEIGFNELLASGAIDKKPRIYAVQAVNCSPLVADYDRRPRTAPCPTFADGIATAAPVRNTEIVDAVRASNGALVSVTETEIARALAKLLTMGWYVEPTTAAGAAGLSHLVHDGRVKQGETTVLVLTGHGLKAGQAVQDTLAQLETG